jgi:hypothetical protein
MDGTHSDVSRTEEDAMADTSNASTRVNPRFSFFADGEVTLEDGKRVISQLSELSARGCYIDTLQPIPVGTTFRLNISDGINACELHGKVIYMQAGGGLGVYGMGVVFGEVDAEQQLAIDAWLRELASKRR